MAGNEDLDAGARRPMRARSSAGEPMFRSPIFGSVPQSVTILAGILALICVALWLAPAAVEETIADRFGLSPARLAAGGAGAGATGWFWALAPLVTHAFLHATGPHLLFNLLWLFVFGTPIARRFASPLRFFTFFALCSAAGGAL